MDYTRLPPEIWIQIIGSLATPHFRLQEGQTSLRPRSSKADLFNISLSSSHFRQLSQPYVFDRFSFSLADASQYSTLRNFISSVSTFINRLPEIKRWIQAISLIGPPDRASTITFNAGLIALFTQLENIESVYISNWTVVPSLLSSLNMGRMREIVVESSLMEQFHSEAVLQPSSMLRSLHLDGIFNTHAAKVFAPLICSPGLERLEILRDVRHFLSIHLQRNPLYDFKALLKLTIAKPVSQPETRMFLAFAQQCAKIHSLHIHSPFADSNPEPSPLEDQHLTRSTFPKLTEFVGSLSIARRIVRDRPISHIKSDNWQDAPEIITRDLLVPLMSTVPVTLLHLRTEWWIDGFLEIIVDLFPALEDFSLKFMSGDFSPWSKSHLVDIRRLPRLQKAVIVCGPRRLPGVYQSSRHDQEQARHRALDSLQETNPDLRFLQLGNNWPWVKKAGVWVMLQSGS